ncbi:MAG: hypothetical protein I3J02_04960 [Prevotella sp.]|nr:hypothetical protein [Prevotella sp.]
MKKLFFAVLAVSAMTIASCGNKTNANAEGADSLADSSLVDTTALSSETRSTINALTSNLAEMIKNKDQKGLTMALANIAATYKALVNSGKLKDALGYGQVVKDYVTKNMDSIKAFTGNNTAISSLLTGIQNLPTNTATTAEEAKQAVSSSIVDMASSTLQKAAATGATAEAAAAALKNLPTTATDAAAAAVSNAKDAAATKANEEVDAAKSKAADAVNNVANKTNDAVNSAASKAVKGLGL